MRNRRARTHVLQVGLNLATRRYVAADDRAPVRLYDLWRLAGTQPRSMGEMDDVNIVAGIIELVAGFGFGCTRIWRELGKVSAAQPTQQVVVRALGAASSGLLSMGVPRFSEQADGRGSDSWVLSTSRQTGSRSVC